MALYAEMAPGSASAASLVEKPITIRSSKTMPGTVTRRGPSSSTVADRSTTPFCPKSTTGWPAAGSRATSASLPVKNRRAAVPPSVSRSHHIRPRWAAPSMPGS